MSQVHGARRQSAIWMQISLSLSALAWYLRKRKRALLIEAFLQEVIDGIEDETVRASAADFVKEGLARAMIDAP